MRRLAFLAAASLAFIAISEPSSAEGRGKGYSKCNSGCYDKIAEKYGRPWSYGDLAPADQRWWMKCTEKCDKDFPKKISDRKICADWASCQMKPSRYCRYNQPDIKVIEEKCMRT